MVARVSRSKSLEILDILNSFYSLRRLEVLLGIPYQVLWRYINLLNDPEEKTAEKIVETVKRLRLLEKAAEEAYEKFEGDIYRLARYAGFIKLCSLLIESAVKELGVNYVYSASSEALPLASAVAVKLEAEVCPITCYFRCEGKGVATIHYISRAHGEIRFITVPKSCLQSERKAIIVDIVVDDLDKLSALKTLMAKFKVKPLALVALQTQHSILELEKLELGEVKILYPWSSQR